MKLPYFEHHYDDGLTLPDRILMWNENRNPAIVCEGREISYQQMNTIADTIAICLAERGVKKGDIVAVDMCRSERFVCTAYGVMRSGACCLPMEHTWPEARKQAVLKASEAVCCICEDDYTAMISGGYRSMQMRIHCSPADNAFVLFTSGSTGVPKGIYITHGRLNAVCGMAHVRHQMHPWLRDIKKMPLYITFSVMAGINFTSRHSIGDTGWLLTEEEGRSPHSVGQAILKYGLQQLIILPEFLRAGLKDEVFRAALRQIKDFQITGGVLTQEVVDELRVVNPQLSIWNTYGMTEIGSITSGYVGDDIRNVGKPVPNVFVAILDENGRDVGVNEQGEICVRSQATTKIYMNAPDLNRTKYFDHPEYGLLFRTGDLGRGDEEGNLYHMGRLDRMVKIRNVRIELDEIEAVLSSFPGVKRGVAAAHGTDPDRFIVGYYQSEEPLDEEALRRHILDTLPQSYMPRFLMRLETIPMTETGKVAYSKLPIPEAGAGIVYEAPETEQERSLSRVLSEVLKMPEDRISMGASFARLGGDSIRAMIAASRLKERGWVLQPHMLHAEPTLRRAAEQMKNAKEPAKTASNPVSYSIPADDMRLITQVAGGEDNVEAILRLNFESRSIFEQLQRKDAVPTNIIHLIRMKRGMEEAQFRHRVQAIVRCHPALRSQIVKTDFGVAWQVVLKNQEPSCYYRDLRYLADGTQLPNEKQIAFCNMYMNFHVSSPRSLQEELTPHFVCFRFADDLCGVGFRCSHALMDGWSYGIVFTELNAAEDPDETDHFVDYMQLHGGKNKAQDFRFWRNYLKNVSFGHQVLPMNPEWENGVMEKLRISMDEELSHRLKQYGIEKHISPTVLLQYLTGQLLCEVLEREELVLEISFAGRGSDVPREDQIVGNLAGVYPVLCGVSQSPEGFHADLRLAEQHTAPGISEIFAAAGLLKRSVALVFSTSALPETDRILEKALYKAAGIYVSPDTLTAIMICDSSQFGVQFSYNSSIFPKEKMDMAESRFRELAKKLVQDV